MRTTGSSLVGWAGGLAYGHAGWNGVVGLAGAILTAALGLSGLLGRRAVR